MTRLQLARSIDHTLLKPESLAAQVQRVPSEKLEMRSEKGARQDE